MDKLKQFINNFHSKICKNKEDCWCWKKIKILCWTLLVLLVSIISYYGYNYFSNKNLIPQVVWANFSLEYRKIPFDAKTLEINFSTDIKSEQINNKTVTLSPFVDWVVSLKNWNTIVYTLWKKLEIWQEYSLTISENTESVWWIKLGKPYIVVFEAIWWAKVTKIIPEKTLNEVSQNLIVLFNIPLIPLTSLDNKYNLPCPIEITPKISWKCSWTSGNIIEFIPTTHWEWATEYKVVVNNADWLLYPLKEKKEVTFKTPNLQLNASNTFSPKSWIFFYSNYPIEKDVVWKIINLTEKVNDKDVKIPVKLVEEKWSETRFSILPVSWSFNYSKTYNLSIPAWVSPKYWNIPADALSNLAVRSSNYITNIEPYVNIYTATWILENTISFYWKTNIPTNNLFFILNFDEEVKLNKELFSFVWSNKAGMNFDIKYWHDIEYDKHWNSKEVETKKKIILTIKDTLKLGTKYSLVINKKANPNLSKDEIHDFSTPQQFKITSFDYMDNSLACTYFNNDLFESNWYSENNPNQSIISIAPTAMIRWITKDRLEYLPPNYTTQKYSCPQKEWQISYLLNIRLDPFKEYKINIPKWLKDDYWNTLDKDYSYNVKSWDIKESDKYIYSSFNKNINVIPSDQNVIIDIQSINVNKLNVEICELDAVWYGDFTNNYYSNNYSPKCLKTQTKEITLKNKNWTLSHNKLDIEKDILWETIKSPIYIIKARISWDNYTTDGKSFIHAIIKSNLSLTYEKANNKNILFASSLDGKDTPGNLVIQGYKTIKDRSGIYKLAPIWEIKTKWIAEKNVYELLDTAEIIEARNYQWLYGILNMNSDQTSNYDFKYIAWQDSSTKNFLYLYTERPIYRPGDTVFFKWILRQFRFDWYHKSEAKKWTLKIMDENYAFFKDVEISIDKNSNFNWKFELPKTMALWKYFFEFVEDWNGESVYNDAKFFVEEYVKPVFKINMEWDKKDVVLWDSVNVKYNTEYYFWWRMWWAHYYSSIMSQNYYFDAKDYSNYQFWDSYSNFDCNYWGYCSYDDNTEFSEEWTMSSEWEKNWNYEFKKDWEWEKIYSFNTTIEDPNTKKQVSNSYSIVLHNTDAYVGLNVPYYSEQKNWIKLTWIVLNYSAQALKDKDVAIELIKRERKEVKKQWVDWVFYNDYSIEEKSEGKFTMTSDSNWEFSDTLMTKWEWEYQIKATYTGINGKSFITTSYIFVAWKEAYYWWAGNNTTTDLTADKSILKIGDTANFTLKSPVSSGKMLVTVEKDDWILDYFTQDIKSNWDRISIPIKSNYYPNIYVKVFLIGKEWTNPLPIYKRALGVIKVMTDDKNIKISIKPEKNNYLPWDKVTLYISTTDSSWKPIANVNWSISLVDESLLALKWNPKKNPFAFFYDMKRYLWVETYLSLFNLVEKLEVKDITDWEKWWAWEWTKWWDSKKKRWVFKDTAFWQADYITDKDWKIKITTEALPDNLTTWVIESVWSTWDDTKIWVWQVTITTTKKVIINENTPRFLGSNDKIIISPVIFNKTGKNWKFVVTLKWTNIEVENPTQEIAINNWAQKTVEFVVKTLNLNSIKETSNVLAKINIKAVSKETNFEDEVERFLPIVETSVKETVATVWSTSDKSHTEKIDLNNIIIWTAKVVINYASSILWNLTSSIEFLNNFAYACMEQNQSAIMPEIYLKKLYNSIWVPYDLTKLKVKVWVDSFEWYKEITKDELIKNYIAESPRFQKTSWGFWYWSDESNYSYANFELTTIVVNGISEIKKLWYTINDKSINDSIKYLKKRFYENKIEWCYYADPIYCKYSEESRLSAINAILNYSKDDYETYKMFKLIDVKNNDISTKITKISVIAKLLNNKNIVAWDKKVLKEDAINIANSIINDYIVYNPRGAFIGKDSYNSRILNTTDFIGAISDLGLDNFKDIEQIIDNMNRWIISQKIDWSFWSTQETVRVIENSAKYMVATWELKEVKWNIKLMFNWVNLDEKNINKTNKLSTFTKIITWNLLKVTNDLVINKEWVGKVFYDISLSYFLPIEKVVPRDEWFYLEQKYYDYNEYSKIKTLQEKENAEYLSWSIDYNDLKYPKNTIEYLMPINNYKVGQIVLANNRIITSEPRDQVAFEWFIPAWSELINTSLSTENQQLKMTKVFDREELRDDRFFWYSNRLDSWVFEFNYLIRITHEWSFSLKPSQISEFYNTEIFWRNKWRIININN